MIAEGGVGDKVSESRAEESFILCSVYIAMMRIMIHSNLAVFLSVLAHEVQCPLSAPGLHLVDGCLGATL